MFLVVKKLEIFFFIPVNASPQSKNNGYLLHLKRKIKAVLEIITFVNVTFTFCGSHSDKYLLNYYKYFDFVGTHYIHTYNTVETTKDQIK